MPTRWYWEYMERDPEEAARFDRAQQAQTRLKLRVLLRVLAWDRFHRLVDVGGGNGAFIGGVLARAAPVLETLGVADR